MNKEITCYEKTFDYEDMKLAMVVQEFYNKHEDKMNEYENYEDFINLCIEIRNAWNDLDMGDYVEEEYAYIQYFAEMYLFDKFIIKGGR